METTKHIVLYETNIYLIVDFDKTEECTRNRILTKKWYLVSRDTHYEPGGYISNLSFSIPLDLWYKCWYAPIQLASIYDIHPTFWELV